MFELLNTIEQILENSLRGVHKKIQVDYLWQWHGRLKTYVEKSQDQVIWE